MSDENIPIRKVSGQPETVNPNLNVPDAVREVLQKDIDAAGDRSTTKITVPFEEFELPSKGHFYSPDSPLSSGKIQIKYMTAKEEDILSSEILIKKGIVLDYLLDSLIVTPNVSVDDLLVADKNAVFVFARKLAYGPEYESTVKCPECGEENNVVIDLDKLQNVDFDFSSYPKGVNEFEFVLPTGKNVVRYKLLRGADEKMISEELKGISKIDKSGRSPELTTRLKKMIVSVDGNTDKVFIKNFVDTLMSRDSLAFRKHLTKNTPNIDLRFKFECVHCGHFDVIPVPMNTSFFWPES